MTAKKKPHELLPKEAKKAGGARAGAGRKGKLVSIETQLEWDKQLERAITQASGNMGVIKKDAFYTLRSVKELWGKAAMVEFKDWFEAHRHYNEEIADKLLTERDEKAKRMKAKPTATLAADLIKLEQKFEKLMMTKAYVWVWSIKSEKQRTAWELTRGVRALRTA